MEASFRPWVHHREGYQWLGPSPIPPHAITKIDQPYTRAEILEYMRVCQMEVSTKLLLLNLEGPSGFAWLPMSKFEPQIYNIRHLMQHTGELSDRLGTRFGIQVDWVATIHD
jgi:hypothetical protein